jgi:hypothetical protein
MPGARCKADSHVPETARNNNVGVRKTTMWVLENNKVGVRIIES